MRTSMKSVLLIAVMAVVIMSSLHGLYEPNSPVAFLGNWYLLLAVMVLGTLGAFILEYESRNLGAKEVSLIAVLSGVATVSRIPFAAFMSFQPCTFIIMCTGYVFGPVAGFMTGATTALASGFILGPGPWTPFQMLSWGLVGASTSMLGRFKVGMTGLMLWGILWGFLFGWIMDLWDWCMRMFPLTLETYIYTMLMSFMWDFSHSLANVIFLSLFGTQLLYALERYKKRFNVDFGRRPDPGGGQGSKEAQGEPNAT